jgi:hypothetical protein
MSRGLARAVYLTIVFVVCPLLAYRVAVAGIAYGLDGRGFFLVLFGLPVASAILAGGLFRVSKGRAAAGAAGALAATFVLVVVLVFLTLESP